MDWVSAKDQLPERDGEYLVTRISEFGKHVGFAKWGEWYRTKKNTWLDVEFDECDGYMPIEDERNTVTHWMELPEPA